MHNLAFLFFAVVDGFDCNAGVRHWSCEDFNTFCVKGNDVECSPGLMQDGIVSGRPLPSLGRSGAQRLAGRADGSPVRMSVVLPAPMTCWAVLLTRCIVEARGARGALWCGEQQMQARASLEAAAPKSLRRPP